MMHDTQACIASCFEFREIGEENWANEEVSNLVVRSLVSEFQVSRYVVRIRLTRRLAIFKVCQKAKSFPEG